MAAVTLNGTTLACMRQPPKTELDNSMLSREFPALIRTSQEEADRPMPGPLNDGRDPSRNLRRPWLLLGPER
ncbi:Uu.00g000190.m01.CDS01 [Anthostomella pinea]|uniref:Uu.00g000190.m01.CDS01 n=1 Tax=Anthostomella pinea TaxID=933095 RepID=A0AAI8VK99_9PEZI|nr:Uu.00g000190.m01.CDS01 [Anthostomella pinea]